VGISPSLACLTAKWTNTTCNPDCTVACTADLVTASPIGLLTCHLTTGILTAHSGAIRGICTDATNARVITVCANGKVKFWDFETRKCLGEQNLGAPVAHARLHRPTNMLALVCDNFVVRFVSRWHVFLRGLLTSICFLRSVYDAETQQLMRTFRGHANRITDVVRLCNRTL
jgi:WD40 repeat protein